MKKFTSFLSVFLILIIFSFTGCSSNSDSVGTAKPAPVKNTISPTATVSLTLNDDTIYDEETFSVVMPKNAKINKNGPLYSWTFGTSKYNVMINVAILGLSFDSSYLVSSDTILASVINSLETAAENTIKIDAGYKKTTINGKNAVLLTGKSISTVAGDVDIYYVDSSKGLVSVVIAKVYYDNTTDVQKEAATAVNNVFSTLTIK